MLSSEEKFREYIEISIKLNRFDANEKKLQNVALKFAPVMIVLFIFCILYLYRNDAANKVDNIDSNHWQKGVKINSKTYCNFKTYYTSSQFETTR